MTLAPAGPLLPGLGLGLALAVALLARALGGLMPLNEVPIAVLGGLLLANVLPLSPGLAPGLTFALGVAGACAWRSRA